MRTLHRFPRAWVWLGMAAFLCAGAFKLRNNSPVVVDNTVKADAGLDPHPENR